ncbi:unnamed protein product [Microthlaspi erraticum]|uniref:Integrase catalytic domain-containing protein n=1 Tax=Microthlaspi erraticum TaxID=1685480 RepID=A0A6D2I4H7_9BRAS|nr:unnamed protein product [Microthlaspi erraticum]
MAFARFIAQIIRLRAHFPDYAIKKVRLDNAGEFTSAAFNDFCMSVGIDVEHPVPHVHTQNGMAESLIKRLQLIARPLILRTKLPITVWGHAILHAGALVQVLVEPDKEVRQDDEPETEKFEISISFAQSGKIWARSEIDDDGMFSFSVAKEIDHENDDPDPTSVSECQKRPDWEKWQMAMKNEIFSLNKRTVVQWSIDRLMLTRIHFDLLKILKEMLGPEIQLIAYQKTLERYLQGTIEFGLYYSRNPEVGLVGFADAGYLSDPHKARSQTGYFHIRWNRDLMAFPKTNIGCNVFKLCGNHCFMKHAESVWLRSLIQHIQEASGVSTKKEPTTIYEDNSACVTQLKEGYIKSDRTKHIPPRFFSYTQELEKNQEVDIQYVRSSDNAADLFTKALPTTVFKKHVQVLECVVFKICEEKIISIFQGEFASRYSFSFSWFLSHWVFPC